MYFILPLILIGLLPNWANALMNTNLSISTFGSIKYAQEIIRPHVNGSKIMLGTSEFLLIGVDKARSLAYYRPNSATPTNWPDETIGVYNLLEDPSTSERETKFNIVTLNINRWLWENDADYIPALHRLVQMCGERGLYVAVRWWVWLNRDWHSSEYDVDYLDDAKKIDQMSTEFVDWRDFVLEMVNEFKNEPYVFAIDPLNEPPPAYRSAWANKGYTEEEAEELYRTSALQIIDVIHSVDPTLIVFLRPHLIYKSLIGAIPFDRPNIVYDVHWYYGWDTEWGVAYADAYWNAETEEDFQVAYQVMADHYQTHMLDFRDTYNVPVMNGDTSMSRISIKSGTQCKNTERQFKDQLRLASEKGFGIIYWKMDRHSTLSTHYALLDDNNAEAWSPQGLLVKDAVNEYY